ncbi:MAG TPA: ATP-dependent helicase, partial [Longimicrobiaceae bacterium]|nr:ATP-dependent helicase [Longimicrobiaceae bacterium]
YRSTQRILDAANAVIAHNLGRKPKHLRTGNGPGPKLDYWEFTDAGAKSAEEQEAEMVARELAVRRYHEKLQWSDFGVLYRTNLQSRPLEEALRAANVPYRVVGGTSYFDRKEVVDAIAYLRVALNPRDEVALRRVINYPTRGIGRTTLLRLVEAARAQGAPLWEILAGAAQVEGITRPQPEAVLHFVQMVGEAGAELASTEAALQLGLTDQGSLYAWAQELFRRIRLEEAIRAENKSEKGAEIRVDNLRDFLTSIATFEARTWAEKPLPDEEETAQWSPPTLQAFLERVSLIGEGEEGPSRKDEREEEPNRVTLMTLHSAKGLEFSHVFLVGMEEEILPHARSVATVVEGAPTDPIAEERRLFYVGVTRARHRLTLSGCATRRRGSDVAPRQPSRFLKEIPAELLEVRSPGGGSSLSEGDRQQMREGFFDQMRQMLAG